MSGLVERLRFHAEDGNIRPSTDKLLREAADALERAERERDEAREALQPFARAAEALQFYDPEFPDDGSILRMSAEWYMQSHETSGGLLKKSLTAGDLRRAAHVLSQAQGEEERTDSNG